jgi:DNA end-binding protein Ku
MQQINTHPTQHLHAHEAVRNVSADDHPGAPAIAGRSSWKGFLRLSLVSIPVKAYTAAVSGNCQIRLNQLHHDCHRRIQCQKVCPVHGKISNDQVVSGYEYAGGQYVVIQPEELDLLRTESDKAIHMDTFVSVEQMDPLRLAGKDYYLTPDGVPGQKPYALLRQAMAERGLWAIAQTVWHGKEQLVVLRPRGRLIVMSQLKYASEVKEPSAFERLELAQALVQATTAEEFDFSKYTNRYQAKLAELIEAKVTGREIVAAEAEEPHPVINLMEALKASVAKARKGADPRVVEGPPRTTKKGSKPKRRPAPRARKPKAASRKKKSA